MKTSTRVYMLKQTSYGAMFEHAAEIGFDGIEMNWVPDAQWPEVLAAVANTGVRPATIAPEAGQKAMHADAGERRAWCDSAKRSLDRCAEVGATGFIVVPTLPNKMQGMPRIPDLWPVRSQVAAEQEVFVAMLHQLGEYAAERGVYVIVECLNRYEQFWPLQLAEGAELVRRADTKGAGLLADFFHMNIEEADIAAAMRDAMEYIVHVHLADSHRRQPGTGHTVFKPGLAELVRAGYGRYLGFEYSLGPDGTADQKQALAYIKGLLADIAAGG